MRMPMRKAPIKVDGKGWKNFQLEMWELFVSSKMFLQLNHRVYHKHLVLRFLGLFQVLMAYGNR